VNRRGFLGGLAGILAAGVAPAAVGSQILMPVRRIAVPESGLVAFTRWQDQMSMALLADQQRVVTAYYRALMDGVACIDTPRIGGGIDRKWISARELYRAT
jgi:hypothetical protein